MLHEVWSAERLGQQNQQPPATIVGAGADVATAGGATGEMLRARTNAPAAISFFMTLLSIRSSLGRGEGVPTSGHGLRVTGVTYREELLRKFDAAADPVRLELLENLKLARGPMTTAALARAVPAAGGGLSWQLRTLAAAGLIRKESGRGQGTLWSADVRGLRWTDDDEDDELVGMAVRTLERVTADRREDRWRRWLSEKRTDGWSFEWRSAAISREYALRLTPEDLSELETEVAKVLERFKERRGEVVADDDTDGAEDVFVSLAAHPVRAPGGRTR